MWGWRWEATPCVGTGPARSRTRAHTHTDGKRASARRIPRKKAGPARCHEPAPTHARTHARTRTAPTHAGYWCRARARARTHVCPRARAHMITMCAHSPTHTHTHVRAHARAYARTRPRARAYARFRTIARAHLDTSGASGRWRGSPALEGGRASARVHYVNAARTASPRAPRSHNERGRCKHGRHARLGVNSIAKAIAKPP